MGAVVASAVLFATGRAVMLDFQGYASRLQAFTRDFGRLRPARHAPIVPADVQRIWIGLICCAGGVFAFAMALLGH